MFSASSTLEFLDLSNNVFLNGFLPSTLFDVPTIRIIYIANCSITGPMPANFGSPPLLRDLFLDGNDLTGTLPEIAAGQLLMLNEFLLQDNLLVGSVPASVCALRNNMTGNLEDLWTDCLGSPPQIECDFPTCCNRCFP